MLACFVFGFMIGALYTQTVQSVMKFLDERKEQIENKKRELDLKEREISLKERNCA